jgi:hypothetical protein
MRAGWKVAAIITGAVLMGWVNYQGREIWLGLPQRYAPRPQPTARPPLLPGPGNAPAEGPTNVPLGGPGNGGNAVSAVPLRPRPPNPRVLGPFDFAPREGPR